MIEWARLSRVGGSTSAIGSSLLGSLLSQGTIFDHIVVGIISFCLFCGGMIMNDLFDVEKDRAMRPNRPLPSGKISLADAKKALFTLVFITIVLAVSLKVDQMITVVLTWLAIYGYNGPLKSQPFLAGFSLATARASNFMIGLSFTNALPTPEMPFPILAIPALAIFLHTISILIYSKGEDLEGPVPKGAWITQCLIFLLLCKWSPISAGIWILSVFIILYVHKAENKMIRIKGVGWMVNAFCLLDACVLMGTTLQSYVPIFFILLFLGRWISRRFPAG